MWYRTTCSPTTTGQLLGILGRWVWWDGHDYDVDDDAGDDDGGGDGGDGYDVAAGDEQVPRVWVQTKQFSPQRSRAWAALHRQVHQHQHHHGYHHHHQCQVGQNRAEPFWGAVLWQDSKRRGKHSGQQYETIVLQQYERTDQQLDQLMKEHLNKT